MDAGRVHGCATRCQRHHGDGRSYGDSYACWRGRLLAGFRLRDAALKLFAGRSELGRAYDDNIVPASRVGISDVSYSVWPSISLDQSRARIRWDLTYRPGFTFYQRHSSAHNEADQNLRLDLDYRLSPYVTLSVQDSFQKTSNSLNLFTGNTGTSTSGVVRRPNIRSSRQSPM